MNAGLDFN